MLEQTAITKNQILSALCKSPHGKLQEYAQVGKLAAENEPEYFAHLIVWNHRNGQVRDAKAALPIVSLSVESYPKEYIENSLAALTLLSPREILKAYRFALEIKTPGHGRRLKRLIADYLRYKEKSGWDRIAIQHRRVLKELYALTHTKPGAHADSVLFKGQRPPHSIFDIVARLKDMNPQEAAGMILERKIPFLIAVGALGAKAKEPDLVLALIERMSPTEVVTNTKMLERLGVKEIPVLRAAFELALERAAISKKTTFKATRAAESVGDEKLAAKLHAVQEKQIQALGGVEGNWLVLGDKSGSMGQTIEISRQVAGTLAKMAMGKVLLCFFDISPQMIDVTNMTYEEIVEKTRNIRAQGGTSIGCGLRMALDKKEDLDGIAIISDAQENTPPYFAAVYRDYCKFADKDIPVFLYRCAIEQCGWGDTDLAHAMKNEKFDLQEFDLTKGVDYYSLPGVIATMRTNRYSLIDEILATPLLTLKETFKDGTQNTD
jgi:hypothetical protein